MKTLLLALSTLTFLLTDKPIVDVGPGHMIGSWTTQVDMNGKKTKVVKIYTLKYFITATYTENQFLAASGGTWEMTPKKITEIYEFHTINPELVGTKVSFEWNDHTANLKIPFEGKSYEFSKIDDGKDAGGKSDLQGAWRITGRQRNGEISQMQMGPRKTFKICSGTRFQWAAYNVETKTFSGTGGGTYTMKDGKYTENIEFFSRDNSRVGASLEFTYEIKGKEWHHSGLSSKGDPIYEIWTNQDQKK